MRSVETQNETMMRVFIISLCIAAFLIRPAVTYEMDQKDSKSFLSRILENTNLMHVIPFHSSNRAMSYILKPNVSILGYNISFYEGSTSWAGNRIVHELNSGEYNLLEMKRLNKIKDGDVVLDLGTNIGLTAIIVAKLWPQVSVIGIEPVPFNYAAALENLKLNGVADRVTLICAALSSNTSQPVNIRYSFGNPGASTTSMDFFWRGSDANLGFHDFSINPVTVDEIVSFYNVTSTPFIKLDCEGCEYNIVPALSPSTLSMFRAALVFGETHCNRMNVNASVVEFVHGVYTAYDQAGRGACGGKVKKWRPN